jgi:hypothetical protein
LRQVAVTSQLWALLLPALPWSVLKVILASAR